VCIKYKLVLGGKDYEVTVKDRCIYQIMSAGKYLCTRSNLDYTEKGTIDDNDDHWCRVTRKRKVGQTCLGGA